jgi:AraC-like DNA-binding protein
MKKRQILFFLLTYTSLFAQTKKDTLAKYSFSDLAGKINNYYGDNNQEKLEATSFYYLEKAKKEKNNEHIVEGYIYLHFSKKLPIALKYLDSVQIVSKKLPANNLYPARVFLLRGNLYFRNDNQKEAFSNYLSGLKYAERSNNERQIALGEIQIAYLNNYIGKSAEAIKVLRRYLYHSDCMTDPEKQELQLNLADTYMDINKIDSAKILTDFAMETVRADKKSRLFSSYLSLLSRYDIKTKNYQQAIDNLAKSKKFFDKEKNQRDINYTLLYLGEAYNGLNNKKKAVEIFSKIDSLVEKTNYTFPELREVYTYIIDYYRQINNKEKQLYYVERFLKVDESLDNDFRYISSEIPRQYDRPKLLEQKEILKNELNKKKNIFSISTFILLLTIIIISIFYYKSKKQEKKHKEKAQELLKSLTDMDFENKSSDSISPYVKEVIESSVKISKSIPIETMQFIIGELQKFENNKLFLKKELSLNSLAKSMNTNSAYLSEVINTYKNKNFSTYLNDLRIELAIKKLVEDKKFRSYKISAIAEELGYNNEQAFSIAFKKKTETTVSTYIKEIYNSKV